MRPLFHLCLRRWHAMLNLSRHPPSWYRDRLQEEQLEVRAAIAHIEKLSEESDVFFSIIRAQCDGFPVGELPPFTARHIIVYMYMLGKFTLRWGFYRMAARICKVPNYGKVCEVVNPGKERKRAEVAGRYQIERAQFERVCRRLRWVWPLLP